MSDDAESTGRPVVHFEISGQHPEGLRSYFGELFDWTFDTDSPVAPEVSEARNYGFIEPAGAGGGIPGGIGGGSGYPSQVIFYVGVPDVEAALRKAVSLGGTRVLGPAQNPSGKLVVGQFRDPEGNLVGVAGPA